MRTITVRPQRSSADFELVTRSFAGQSGLPLSSVLPAEVIEAVFRRHDALFGGTYNAIYVTVHGDCPNFRDVGGKGTGTFFGPKRPEQ